MTACVNKKKSGVVSKVVTASLVGALTLGGVSLAAVPTVAVAETGATEQATNEPESVQQGSISEFEDAYEAGHSFTYNGKAQGLVPTKVTGFGESVQTNVDGYRVYKLTDASNAASIEFTTLKLDGKSFFIDSTFGVYKDQLPTETGDYAVFAYTNVNGTEVVTENGAKFSINAADLADASLYEVKSDAEDLSDTEFVFDDAAWNLGTAAGNLGVKADGVSLSLSDFDAPQYRKDGKTITAADVKKAGDYELILTGKQSGPYEGQKVSLKFTVKPYDLATAPLYVNAVEAAANGNNSDASVANNLLVGDQALSNTWLNAYVDLSVDTLLSTGTGNVTVSANDDALKAADVEGSVVNSQKVSYDVVKHVVTATLYYDGKVSDGNYSVKVDFSDPDNYPAFDASKVKVEYTDPATGKTVKTDKYTLRVIDADGNVGGADMLQKSGYYKVYAVLNAKDLGYAVGGQNDKGLDVSVTKGTVTSAQVAFAYKGEVTSSIKTVYTPGYNVLNDVKVTVTTDNGVVDPSDYTVKATKDGKDVDSITDAGTYTLKVVADGYNFSSAKDSITVTVSKRDLSTVKVRAKDTFNYTQDGTDHRVIRYTGSELAPSYEWSADGKTWYDLPADDYVVKYYQNNKEVKLQKVGNYQAKLTAKGASANYTGNGESWPEVSDKKVFSDVPNDAWYSQSVYNAADHGFINGYSGTKLFGPNDPITRGQVATILFNMAGNTKVTGFEGEYSKDHGYETGFSDVDGKMYYAQAIAWAKKAGVVNGADGKFRPDDAVTREEFVSMLANYATLRGDDMTTSDSDLAKFADASQVSGYAKANVAWAAKNGYVNGQDGSFYPARTITRAEVAAVADNYQPEGVDDTLLGK